MGQPAGFTCQHMNDCQTLNYIRPTRMHFQLTRVIETRCLLNESARTVVGSAPVLMSDG